MRRSLTGISGLLTLLASLILVAPVSAQNDPASRAVRYLSGLQGADGSIDAGTPAHTLSETAYAAMGAAAAGLDPAQLRTGSGPSVVDYLANHSASLSSSDPDAAAAPTAEVILAAVAARQNPRHFGMHNVDLVHRLEVTDKSHGLYGFGDTRAQALGLLGEVASATPVDAQAVARLRGMQNPDGSWNQGVAAGAPGDTDSTAIAVMALSVAVHQTPSQLLTLSFLHGEQNSDGGFAFQKASVTGANSNPVSDGIAIQALLAAGQNPTGQEWAVSGHTPFENMLSFQASSGGFRFTQGFPTPVEDAATTAPIVAAAALQPLPVRIAYPAGEGLPVQTAAVIRALQFQAKNLDPSNDPFAPGEVEDTLLGMASAGFDPATLTLKDGRRAYPYLAAHIPKPPDPGGTGHLIVALEAGGLDPTAFPDSVGVVHNLVKDLSSTYNATSPTTSDPGAGSFGDGSVYGDAYAILGEVAAHQNVATNFPLALQYLHSRQHGDGSFDYTSNRANPGDTNSTSVALQALDAAGDHGADRAGLLYLSGEQSSFDGGFAYSGKPQTSAFDTKGTPSDPDSTALVVEALVAMHRNPLAYAQGCATPVSYLLTAQDRSGGYIFPGAPAADSFTTSQVVQGVERVASPVPSLLMTSGRALPAAEPAATASGPPSGCDYTPPQDPPQPASGPVATRAATRATTLRRVFAAQRLARSNFGAAPAGTGAVTAASTPASPPSTGAGTTASASSAPAPLAAGPILGGVKGLTMPVIHPRVNVAGGAAWWAYPLAAVVTLALVMLTGLAARRRRGGVATG